MWFQIGTLPRNSAARSETQHILTGFPPSSFFSSVLAHLCDTTFPQGPSLPGLPSSLGLHAGTRRDPTSEVHPKLPCIPHDRAHSKFTPTVSKGVKPKITFGGQGPFVPAEEKTPSFTWLLKGCPKSLRLSAPAGPLCRQSLCQPFLPRLQSLDAELTDSMAEYLLRASVCQAWGWRSMQGPPHLYPP